MNIKTKFALATGILALVVACTPATPVGGTLGTAIVGEQVTTDALSLGYSQMNNVTDTKSYTYTCTSDTSDLSVGGVLSGGDIELTVSDGAGNLVINKTFSAVAGYTQILVAPAGDWNVNLDLDGTSGQIGVELNTRN